MPDVGIEPAAEADRVTVRLTKTRSRIIASVTTLRIRSLHRKVLSTFLVNMIVLLVPVPLPAIDLMT